MKTIARVRLGCGPALMAEVQRTHASLLNPGKANPKLVIAPVHFAGGAVLRAQAHAAVASLYASAEARAEEAVREGRPVFQLKRCD